MTKTTLLGSLASLLAGAMLFAFPQPAGATILGETGSSFTLIAQPNTIFTGDGDSMYMWLYSAGTGRTPQYPGPTLIVNQGASVSITLVGTLPAPTSLVFPGLNVTATGGVASSNPLATRETCVGAGCTPTGQSNITYTFVADRPGTFQYHSGSRPDLQVEMGLAGTIIVRPGPGGCPAATQARAYEDASTCYDREYLFFLSEADPIIHTQVAFASGTLAQRQAAIAAVDTTLRHAVDWFINGRNFPDTVTDPGVPWLPTQPYSALPRIHPGEKVLMRLVSGGFDLHPFHTHGQNHLVIARDARVVSSTVTTSTTPAADMALSDYTTTSVPGETVDAIWGPWTGAKLGWDIYGTNTVRAAAGLPAHTCTATVLPTVCNGPGNPPAGCFDPTTHEFCADHNVPLKVDLPSDSYVQYGPFWGGTPYLGFPGTMPPLNPDGTVHVNKNPLAGISFMWHSHSERELTTNDIFIGGMATMAIILPVTEQFP
jgi:manganese oxidase